MNNTIKVNLICEFTWFRLKANGISNFFERFKTALEKYPGIKVGVNDISNDYDIVHSQTPGPFAYLKTRSNAVSVITTHVIPETFVGQVIFDRLLQKEIYAYGKWIFDSHDYVIALSDYIKDIVIKMGIKKKK